jgi:hypothetical protein
MPISVSNVANASDKISKYLFFSLIVVLVFIPAQDVTKKENELVYYKEEEEEEERIRRINHLQLNTIDATHS